VTILDVQREDAANAALFLESDEARPLTGNIPNSRVSVCREPDVLSALDVRRSADVTHAHLEIPLHDFGPDIHGAAEGALSWMRGPTWVADELSQPYGTKITATGGVGRVEL
jgi:hypothetical protein